MENLYGSMQETPPQFLETVRVPVTPNHIRADVDPSPSMTISCFSSGE